MFSPFSQGHKVMSRIFFLTVLSPKYGSLHSKVTLSVNSVQHSRLSFGCHVRLNSQSPRPWTQQKFCSPYHSHMSDWPWLSSRQRGETRRNTAPCRSSLFFSPQEKGWGCLKGLEKKIGEKGKRSPRKNVRGVECLCVHLDLWWAFALSWAQGCTYKSCCHATNVHVSPPTFLSACRCHSLILVFHSHILYPFPTRGCARSYTRLTCLSLACLVSATSPMASWCACWCLKTMVIQVEQEAIVSGIWALSTEAGHRSHEGANADSALVDWLRPCPPQSIPPNIIMAIRVSSI